MWLQEKLYFYLFINQRDVTQATNNFDLLSDMIRIEYREVEVYNYSIFRHSKKPYNKKIITKN